MREILFRGKHMAGSPWCYGNLAVRRDGAHIITPDDTPCGVYGQVDPATVGQYTGVKDKNGVYIYEGDIIRAVLPETRVLKAFVWPLQVVVFRDGAFGLERWGNGKKVFVPFRSYALSVTFEIVGDIHDNPDMMEGE